MGAYHMKQRALVGLSWLNLGLAVASLARHIPREFFSFNLELQKGLLDHFSFTNLAPSWVIPGAGLLVATMELALASRFLGTRLFWSTAMVAGGWGMLVKTQGLGLDHLIVSGFLALLALCTLCLNLQNTTAPFTESTKAAETAKSVKISRNSYKNPGLGMDCKVPKKSLKRATIDNSNPVTRLDFSFLRENSNGHDVGESQPEEIQGGPRRSSASEPSKIFAKKSIGAVQPALSVLPVLDEEPDHIERVLAPSAKLSPIRRCSERFQHVAIDVGRCMGMGERIGRLIGGALLGFIILLVVAGLVVLADSFFSVSVLKDLARVFRNNIASFKKNLAVEL